MRDETAEKLLEKVRADYDSTAAAFSASRARVWPMMERFAALARNGDRVLDIGCGNGRAYQLFAGRAIEYEGIDVSAKLIAIARDRYKVQLADFRVGTMLALPYDDESFEAAFAFAVLHHIPSKVRRLAALREAYRVTKPGGRFALTVWDLARSRYWWRVALAVFLEAHALSKYDFGDVFIPWRAEGSTVRRYCHAFTLGGLRHLALHAGFDVLESGREGGNLYLIGRRPE